jgi:hypothetical protein
MIQEPYNSNNYDFLATTTTEQSVQNHGFYQNNCENDQFSNLQQQQSRYNNDTFDLYNFELISDNDQLSGLNDFNNNNNNLLSFDYI